MYMPTAFFKSPLIPLFQRAMFLSRALTPLWQRGEGEIFGENIAAIIQRISDRSH